MSSQCAHPSPTLGVRCVQSSGQGTIEFPKTVGDAHRRGLAPNKNATAGDLRRPSGALSEAKKLLSKNSVLAQDVNDCHSFLLHGPELMKGRRFIPDKALWIAGLKVKAG